jgi:cytochrome c-type biogenesis protein CcmH
VGRFVLLLILIPGICAAQDPVLDKRVAALAEELRCLVCQNQTLADSNAPLAVDLRNQMREQLAKGASEREVREFMVARYGDFVLYRPPFKASTAALWIGPFALLLAGLGVLVRRLRSRRAPEPALSPAERERAAKLLE